MFFAEVPQVITIWSVNSKLFIAFKFCSLTIGKNFSGNLFNFSNDFLKIKSPSQSINEGNNDTSAIDSGNNDKGDDSDKTIDNYNINSYSNIDIAEIKQNNSSIDHETIIQLTRKTNEINSIIETIKTLRQRKTNKEKQKLQFRHFN